jgi:hypothetical protein
MSIVNKGTGDVAGVVGVTAVGVAPVGDVEGDTETFLDHTQPV